MKSIVPAYGYASDHPSSHCPPTALRKRRQRPVWGAVVWREVGHSGIEAFQNVWNELADGKGTHKFDVDGSPPKPGDHGGQTKCKRGSTNSESEVKAGLSPDPLRTLVHEMWHAKECADGTGENDESECKAKEFAEKVISRYCGGTPCVPCAHCGLP